MKTQSTSQIGSRIKDLIIQLELNQTSFAESIGVSQNAIFKTISGQTTPRFSFIDTILKTYPNINRDWLLEGKGEMFNTSTPKPTPEDSYLQTYLKQLEEKFEKLLNQKDKLIESQQYLIEHLSGQLGKLDGVVEEAKVILLWGEKEEIGQSA